MQQQPLSSPQHPNQISSPMQPPFMPQPMIAPIPEGPRWKALRIVAGLLKVLAWIELVLGLIVSLASFGMSEMFFFAGRWMASFSLALAMILPGILTVLLIALIAGIIFLFLYSISELLLLLVAIENNTRPRRG